MENQSIDLNGVRRRIYDSGAGDGCELPFRPLTGQRGISAGSLENTSLA